MKNTFKVQLKIILLFTVLLLPGCISIIFFDFNETYEGVDDTPKINHDVPRSSDVYYEATPGGYCQGIAVDGDIAFLACGGNGMAVMNISNPTNPTSPVFSTFLGWAYGVDISGDYAYVAAGNGGLRIVDVETPIGPPWTSTYRDTSGNAYDVHVSGNYAYVADGSSGLAVIDITTPLSPGATVYYENTGGSARDVFVRGDYAYIADYGGGFAVIDISNPTNPGTPETETTNGDALAIYVEGDYAYVATSNGLNVINVTDPTNPDYLTMISTGYSSGIDIDGNYAYVGVGVEGLAIVNVTDPLNPTDLVKVDTDEFAIEVEVWGNYAFCADNSSMAIIDVSKNLETPEVITHVTTTENAYDIDVEGNYAYLACYDAGLAVIDISDPENPGAPIYGTCLGNVTGVDVVGDYAFCATYGEDLVIFDVSDPTNPHKVMNQTTTGECKDIHVEGDYAFIADGNSGLAVIDISNPLSPGTAVYAAVGYSVDVEVNGNYAYMSASSVRIVDISDPTSPSSVASVTNSDFNQGIDISGNFAYVATQDSGLTVIDITTPTSPGTTYPEDTIGRSRGIWISGNTAYMADGYDGGLTRIGITNPRNPGTPSYTNVDTRGYEVQVHGDYAFLAVIEHSIQERGLCIVKVRERIDRYDPIITDSPSDFSAAYGYSGESVSWTAYDMYNWTYDLELLGTGSIISGANWDSGIPVTYNIPDGFNIGSYTYRITFYDNDTRSTSDEVTFTVDPPSVPTAVSSPPNATIELGYSSHSLEWNIVDDNPATYTLNRTDIGQIVGPTGWSSGNPFTYELPQGIGVGTYIYVLSALDGNSNELLDGVEITVADNLAPVITQYSANLTVEVGYSDLTYTWTATDGEPDTYTIDLVGTGEMVGSTVWTSGTQVEFDLPEGLGEGYHQFMINFTDNSDNWTNHSIWLVVGPDETDPVFTETPSDVSVEEGYASVGFTWTATDANPATYTIELVGTGNIAGPNTFTSGVNITYYVPAGLSPGAYTYTITFTDDYDNSISDSVTLTVTEKPKPKIPFGNWFIAFMGLSVVCLVAHVMYKLKTSRKSI